MISIGFFGTPQIAATVLSSLIESGEVTVKFVVSQPDKPTGRHLDLMPTPVKSVAEKHRIPLFQPEKIKTNTELFDTLRAYDVDYFIVVAYGRIMPLELINMPKKMCINIHGSILPKYRGASPIQSSLMAGDEVTGITLIKMSEGMDEGDILDILEIPVDPFETSETLFRKMAIASGPFVIETLKKINTHALTPKSQNHDEATYCSKIDKSLGRINLHDDVRAIFHLWQWLTPWPGVWINYMGKHLVIERADYLPGIHEFETGEVVKVRWKIWIQCGKWILFPEQVKLEGKKSMDIASFINGHPWFLGSNVL